MHQLPREILQQILHYIGDDQQTLASLNRTCRVLHDTTLAALYNAPSFASVDQLRSFVSQLSPRSASKLTKLDLKDLPHRWNVGLSECLEALVQKASAIEYLDLSLCRVNQRVLRLAIDKFRLRFLSIHSNRSVDTAAMISSVYHQLTELREVDLGETNITDESLTLLADHCPKLEWVDVEGCQHVTEIGVEYLAKHAASLKYLNVKDCFNIVPGPDGFDDFQVQIDWAEWEDDGDDDDDGDDA